VAITKRSRQRKRVIETARASNCAFERLPDGWRTTPGAALCPPSGPSKPSKLTSKMLALAAVEQLVLDYSVAQPTKNKIALFLIDKYIPQARAPGVTPLRAISGVVGVSIKFSVLISPA